MNMEIKLTDFGDSMIQAAAAQCSSQDEAKDFIEFLFRNVKLKCKKCSFEFDELKKRAIAGIDKTLQYKNSLYATQYELAKSFGILSASDTVQCPKCTSGYAIMSQG